MRRRPVVGGSLNSTARPNISVEQIAGNFDLEDLDPLKPFSAYLSGRAYEDCGTKGKGHKIKTLKLHRLKVRGGTAKSCVVCGHLEGNIHVGHRVDNRAAQEYEPMHRTW